MYLTDYHTHTKLSPDSGAPLSAMAEAAVAAGLQELCVTDHVDLLGPFGEPLPGYCWADSLAQFERVTPLFQSRLRLKLGIELGVPNTNPGLAEEILSQPRLDFVIGSIHNQSPARGGQDFYYAVCDDLGGCYEALDDYFSTMEVLAQTDYYDVLGHIIYPLRYMPMEVPLDRYWPQIERILRTAAQRGRGIEVNTYRGRTLADWEPVLALYKACGGEIITLGSDAHAPRDVGAGIADACRLIADAGFRYIATYTGRTPEFHKL